MVLLGVIHLIATPHIPPLIDAMRASRMYPIAKGAGLINHLMTGILLLPLGFTTWLAADPANVGRRWARFVLLANSLAMLTAPLVVVLSMREAAESGVDTFLTAPLFLAGVGLATALPVVMVGACLSLIFRA